MGLEIFRHDDQTVLDMLSGYFQDGTLVPVFGAGFTVGETASSGNKVPKGAEFQGIMFDQLAEYGMTDAELDSLKKGTFSDVSDVYFDPNFVPSDVVKKTLQDYFLDVTLGPEKRSLINDIDWKYIYTLNIDNAIEKHSKFRPIYPYDAGLSDNSRGFSPVYKLHGDVFYEVTHTSDRLVFRKASYLESIQSNRRMLSLLQEDMLNKNVIYIGCSLSDENDIAFLVASKNIPGKVTRRIVFSNEEPDRIEASKLKRHGVNTVILIDKGEYSQPYKLLQAAYLLSAENDKEMDRFVLDLKYLGDDPKENQDFLIQGVADVGSEHGGSASVLPYYYASRDVEQELLESTLVGGVVVVSGPRVSGKTLLTRSVVGKIKDRRVYFVESGTALESTYLNKLMGLKSSVIVFDAKTIDLELAKIIRNNVLYLRGSSTTVLCVVDSSDGVLVDALNSTRLVALPLVQVDRKFSAKESRTVNQRFKSVRCPSFRGGRKLLDNLFNAYNVLGQDTVIKRVPKEKDFLALLYVLSVKRKVDGDWVNFVSASHTRLDELISKSIPYLDYERVGRSELASHAGYKVVCNSEVWLLAVLSELYRARGVAWCIDSLLELVRGIPPEESRLAIELTLFDNLNFAFAGDKGGAAELIIGFYERLEDIRGSEAEFFVQKAKAYYNMYRQSDGVEKLGDRIRELTIAETWAQSERDEAAERNIRHIIALVSLRRAYDDAYSTTDYAVDAVNRTWRALSEEHFNSAYVAKLAEGSLRGSDYLAGLLFAIQTGKLSDVRILQVKDKIEFIRSRTQS